ncbi:MAG: 3-phosphoshikimate 1-carboxyvinyltransferase [Alphaproteobacteria bacterium]
MKPITSHKASPLTGTLTIPGDKSISHRAIMFGALAEGTTTITGLLEGEDVLHTADAMRAMGAKITKDTDGTWHVTGIGAKGLNEPTAPLEMGNSGTSTRLLMGLVSGYPITCTFTGDASLSKRPMARVINPLTDMGASFEATNGDKLPLTTRGSQLTAITYPLPIASAQVKSAILLAGLNASGTTTVIETKPTRDHTENMLGGFGVEVKTQEENGRKNISIAGGQTLNACHINVPADPSSAAFPIAAAILTEGSDITIPNICINPTRTGIYTALEQMGADLEWLNKRTEGGEPVADLRVRGTGPLNAITLDPELVPAMIDEFPIFAMVAASASGTSIMTDLAELRVKESDRLLMVAQGLKACGVSLEMGEDSLTIHGNGKPPTGGATIKTALDHRIAMAFTILGGTTTEPVTIDDSRPIATSFPNFINLMNGLGYDIK